MFELVEDMHQGAKIKVIGVGGGGGNAVNTMIRENLEGVDFIAANTDLQALTANLSKTKLQLGRELTKGLGAGANPDVGRNAALEDTRELAEALMGADMVFITAGMGGGTGTGAAPIVAKVAKECGALTVGVVTKPFGFEGKRRSRFADDGINNLRNAVDTLITIPNEKLLGIAGRDTTILQTFKMADEVLLQAVRGIANLITTHGLINLDFADVRAVMSEMGMALMGTGSGCGENRAIDAATKAISSPLLENLSIRGATGIIINVTGGANMTLHEVNEASKLVQEEAHDDANIIFGAVIDEALEDEIRVTVIATGFQKPTRGARVAVGNVRGGTETVRDDRLDRQEQLERLERFERTDRTDRTDRVERTEYTDRAERAERPVAQDWGTLWNAPPAAPQNSSLNVGREDGPQLGLQTIDERPVGATTRSPAYDPEEPRRLTHADLKELMAEIGVPDQRDDQYDIPTFLRKQAD